MVSALASLAILREKTWQADKDQPSLAGVAKSIKTSTSLAREAESEKPNGPVRQLIYDGLELWDDAWLKLTAQT